MPCTIKVSIYNSGDANVTAPFEARLYVGSAPAAKCSWVLDSLVKNGGLVKSCSYTFPSWYGSIGLRGVADEDDVINEKNEGNNELTVNISVAP